MPSFLSVSYLAEYIEIPLILFVFRGGGGKKKKGSGEMLEIILMLMLRSSLIKAFWNKWHGIESMSSMGYTLLSALTYVVISGNLLHLFGKDNKTNQP